MTSLVELIGCELAVPGHATVSRRAIKLPSIASVAFPHGPLRVVIDSAGLKIYAAAQWLADKHSRRAPRHRKLHLAVDADSGQIVAATLTGQDVDDPSQVAPLRAQIPGEIEQVTADRAYNGEPTYAIIAAQRGHLGRGSTTSHFDGATRTGEGRVALRRPCSYCGGARRR